MTQLIDKSAVVAKIERMIKHYNESAKEFGDEGYNDNVLMEQCKANACKHILSFLDTLEVKEVDLEKEIDFAMPSKYCWSGDGEAVYSKEQMRNFAKHFFELGLKANKPITAADRGMVEEIIIILKRLEKDYHMELNVETAVSLVIREMERLSNKAQKGE